MLPVEETLAAARDNRMNHQRQLVEEVGLKQAANQGGTAGNADVFAGLLLQPGDCFGEVAGDQVDIRPIPPLDLVERG